MRLEIPEAISSDSGTFELIDSAPAIYSTGVESHGDGYTEAIYWWPKGDLNSAHRIQRDIKQSIYQMEMDPSNEHYTALISRLKDGFSNTLLSTSAEGENAPTGRSVLSGRFLNYGAELTLAGIYGQPSRYDWSALHEQTSPRFPMLTNDRLFMTIDDDFEQREGGSDFDERNHFDRTRDEVVGEISRLADQRTAQMAERAAQKLVGSLIYAAGQSIKEVFLDLQEHTRTRDFAYLVSALGFVSLGDAVRSVISLLETLQRHGDVHIREAAENALDMISFDQEPV